MKKCLIVFLLFFVIVSSSVFSQTSDAQTERKFSFLINPLLIITNVQYLGLPGSPYGYLFGFEFQYALNKFFTFSVEPRFGISNYLDTYLVTYSSWYGYGARGSLLDGLYSEKLLLFTMNPGLLYKPFGTFLKGWYVGLYGTIGYKNLSRKDDRFFGYPDVDTDFLLLGITSGSGYQWVFKNGFTISLGAALGKVWEIGDKDEKHRYMVIEYIIPLDFIFNCKIGFSF